MNEEMSAMAKGQRPSFSPGVASGTGGSEGFSIKLNTVQAKRVGQVLGKTKGSTPARRTTKAPTKKQSK
jgi:hypothetical protein